jgi:hypothetical protein
MIDGLRLAGVTLPRDHRCALATTVEGALPWLAGLPGAGMHPLNLVHGTGREVLLSSAPADAAVAARACDDAVALAGVELDIAGHRLRTSARRSAGSCCGTALYAHFVAGDETDELAFLGAVKTSLPDWACSAG